MEVGNKNLFGLDERFLNGNRHMRIHSDTLPRVLRRNGGSRSWDGDIEASPIHMKRLRREATPTGPLSDDQGSAQPLHDGHKLFSSPSGHRAGENDHALPGAVPLTLKRQEKMQKITTVSPDSKFDQNPY